MLEQIGCREPHMELLSETKLINAVGLALPITSLTPLHKFSIKEIEPIVLCGKASEKRNIPHLD